MKRQIYVASSWRNVHQPGIVGILRADGHEVYDFRNPAPDNKGFAWSDVDREWLNWTPENYVKQINSHPVAASGFKLDKNALDWCDTCILVLPCGRSAHLEAGYTIGQGKDTFILLHEDKFEPELMYLLGDGCSTSIHQIMHWMNESNSSSVMRWHIKNGGTFTKPSHHATRLLREVIELCVAAGASQGEILDAFLVELHKAEDRHEFGGDPSKIPEEWADCAMLLDVFAKHAGIDTRKEIREKLDVLWYRQWQPDEGGALYRPRDTGELTQCDGPDSYEV